MKLADRMQRLGTETAFAVLAQINNFPPERRARVISFAIGEPDFNTPEHIKQAGIQSIAENNTHYVPSAGLMELREEVAKFASATRGGMPVTPEMVTILPSAKMVIGVTMLTCMDPGDEVLYPNPGYPIYESQIRVFGGKPVSCLLDGERGFEYDVDRLRASITDKTRMIVINSPQNPTGGVLSKANLQAIAEIALENDLWVLSDEIYSNFLYDNEQFHSIAQIPEMQERTIILDGFSKFFAMTGWRLGYSITNPEVAKHFANWATNSISCTAPFVQHAGLAALREDQAPSWEMVKAFDERRRLICNLLNDIDGISVRRPKGAFYLFANVTEACKKMGLRNALAFQQFLLDKADVAVLARAFFGSRDPSETQEYIRFSYCVSTEDITAGCARIKKAVEDAIASGGV
jgi:aspartate/methionine/tyrosine aminotransferase